jgi:uncharacterized protein
MADTSTFLTEHYWGYSRHGGRGTLEDRVEHPRWRVWRADASELSCDVAVLYGPEFVADGSPIVVHKGRRLE